MDFSKTSSLRGNMKLTIFLTPYVFNMFLILTLVWYRIHRPYKKDRYETVGLWGGMWMFAGHNIVELILGGMLLPNLANTIVSLFRI